MGEWVNLSDIAGFRHETQFKELSDGDKETIVYNRIWSLLYYANCKYRETVFPGHCTFLKVEAEAYRTMADCLNTLNWHTLAHLSEKLVWVEAGWEVAAEESGEEPAQLPPEVNSIIDKVMTLCVGGADDTIELVDGEEWLSIGDDEGIKQSDIIKLVNDRELLVHLGLHDG